jgi:hypothetical protein
MQTAVRAPLLGLVVCGLLLAACSGDLGPPRPHPVPEPDPVPALLGAGPLSSRLASYRIAATWDPDAHHLTATEHITWKNGSHAAVKMLPLQLFLNAFKNDQSTFM